MNLIDWILVLLILGLVCLAVFSLHRQKKNGKSCCGCDNCSIAGKCSKKQ
ncbi:MAG: FeoB-associated Cys-rich membrane protein [Ruminococcus sp.]|nr:FeoB-associated Cys-rich membrane protein [Ruminococcus sp.]